MKTNLSKFIIAGVIIALIILFFVFDLKQYLALEVIKGQQDALNAYYQNNTLLTIGIYMFIYISVTALSLPGAAVMTLVGGGLFGLLVGGGGILCQYHWCHAGLYRIPVPPARLGSGKIW